MPGARTFRFTVLGLCLTLLAGCGSSTIRPDYGSSNPNLRVGGDQPVDGAATIEPAGAFCLEVKDVWHDDGKTPDGERIYARDTLRRAVSCDPEQR